MFRFSILWNQGDHCPDILDEAAAIIQRTVDVNAIPVATKRPEGKKVGVPTTECLQLMEDIALACLRDEVYIRSYVPYWLGRCFGFYETDGYRFSDFGPLFGQISP
jgi:hypothetical protein